MSYSFQYTAVSKDAAKAQGAVEFDKVVAAQPSHAKDRSAALANLNAAIDLLEDDPSKDVTVSMNGYLSGTWSGHDVTALTGVSIGVSVNLKTR